MVISKNSQLGLMFFEKNEMLEYLDHCKKCIDRETRNVNAPKKDVVGVSDDDLPICENDGDELFRKIAKRMRYNPELKGSEFYTVKHPKPYLYLIQQSVHTCAELIRVNDNFSCTIFNRIKDGEHVYLLGKTMFYRFVKFNGAIRGSFWDREKGLAFEVGFDLEEDKYFFPTIAQKEFNDLVRLMIFIELGDIEVVELASGRNNGKSKKSGKISNQTDYNVFVVDSSWNQIIIRTDGFAVRGHFRLQPCGVDMKDRKLIWIAAFEKHGYKRQPKAKILE